MTKDPEMAIGSKEDIILRCVEGLNDLSLCGVYESSVLEVIIFSLRSEGRVFWL